MCLQFLSSTFFFSLPLLLRQASWLLLFSLCWVFHEEQLWPQVPAQVLQHPLLAAAGKTHLMCQVARMDFILSVSEVGIWGLGFPLLLKDPELIFGFVSVVTTKLCQYIGACDLNMSLLAREPHWVHKCSPLEKGSKVMALARELHPVVELPSLLNFVFKFCSVKTQMSLVMSWTVQGQLLKSFALPMTDLPAACAQIQLACSLRNCGCLAWLSGKAKAEWAWKGGILSCGALEEDLWGDHRGVFWNQQNMLFGVHIVMYLCFLLDANCRQLILIIFHQKVESLCIFIQIIPTGMLGQRKVASI